MSTKQKKPVQRAKARLMWADLGEIERVMMKAEIAQLREEKKLCSNSVVEACLRFPNVSMYVLQLEVERDQLRAELAALREDKKRLDWLEGAGLRAKRNVVNNASVRAALDAAREEGK